MPSLEFLNGLKVEREELEENANANNLFGRYYFNNTEGEDDEDFEQVKPD
jgi:hypothetical protein